MSQYLTLKDVVKDCEILVICRNNDVVQYIIDNYRVGYNDYTRIDDISFAIEDINKSIGRMEGRINAMLIKRDFDVDEYLNDKEFLAELYETRGRLYTINGIIDSNKNVQMNYS